MQKSQVAPMNIPIPRVSYLKAHQSAKHMPCCSPTAQGFTGAPARLGPASPGQAIAEFALAFALFTVVVFGLIDAARAIYTIQGLTRAAEAIAHQTDLVVNATYTGPGRAASPIAFDTTPPTTVTNLPGSGYQKLSNSNVYVCGAPNLATPWVIKVTVVTSFTPITSFFIGQRQITLSRSATVFTALGEQSGTPSSLVQSLCP
jgi:Flp pilus assembly protein TadG